MYFMSILGKYLVFIHNVGNAKELLPDSNSQMTIYFVNMDPLRIFQEGLLNMKNISLKNLTKKWDYYHSQLLNLNKYFPHKHL